jgi:hypothetical protein
MFAQMMYVTSMNVVNSIMMSAIKVEITGNHEMAIDHRDRDRGLRGKMKFDKEIKNNALRREPKESEIDKV